jgi:flagellar assembly protein FliH
LSNSKIVKSYQQYEIPPEVLAILRSSADEKTEKAEKTEKTEKSVSSIYDEAAETVQKMLDNAAAKAEERIRAAEEEAAGVIRGATKQCDAIKQDAEAEGFDAGYARGAEEGRRATETAVAAYIEEIKALVECIRAERTEALYREEKDLILIAVEAAEKIMRQQCRIDMNAVSNMLGELVREHEGAVRLYLSEFQHTLELHLDKNITKKIKRFASGLKTVLVKEDDSIMLETDMGVVDASIPAQLETVKEMLIEDL